MLRLLLYTESFPLENGLVQGECLSPSLYSMCIKGMTCIESVDVMGLSVDNIKISDLKYDDDTTLLTHVSL